MLRAWKFGLSAAVLGYIAACAPVKFEGASDPACGDNGVACVQACTGDGCFRTYTVERRVGDSVVDILFVNDNSGSMSFEQERMAQRFPTFIQALGNIDYRIAMVTTDISSVHSSTPRGVRNDPKPANGNGAFQDGRLLEFSPGVRWLTRSTANRDSLFAATVKRQETLSCEQNNFAAASCPSNDERGVFAANLVVESTGKDFLRPTAHLAVVILSDEDERGLSDNRAALNDNDRNLIKLYPLEAKDRPQTFVDNMRTLYPNKTFSVHSIIVRPPVAPYAANATEVAEGTSCRNQQTGQTGNPWVRGVPGFNYAELSRLTGGRISSICASDYGATLTDIGANIEDQVTSLPFQCPPVERNGRKYTLYINDQINNSISVTPDYERLVLNFNASLPPLTRVKLVYDCRI